MTESELIDKVLEDAKDCSAISVRSTPDDYDQALMAARQYGLIEKPVNGRSYCLAKSGRLAINLGGFDKWLAHEKKENTSRQSINIGGSVTGSQIGQGSHFEDIIQDRITSNAPITNEKKQDTVVSLIEKFIIPIIIGVVISVIALIIEHKTGFFSGR